MIGKTVAGAVSELESKPPSLEERVAKLESQLAQLMLDWEDMEYKIAYLQQKQNYRPDKF